MTTFRQVVSKIQDGLLEEARVGLEFVLRLDPTFSPGLELQRQLASGRESIDLAALISHIKAPSTDTINLLLVEAVEEYNQRNYLEAKEKVSKVLLDLPGHAEARSLLGQVEESLKVETQVGQFLTQAREALDRGDPEESANFVMMAQALDPHHRGIQAMLDALQTPGPPGGAQPTHTQHPALAPPYDAVPGNAVVASVPRQAQPEPSVADADEDSWNIANAFAPSTPDSPASSDPPEPSSPPQHEADSDISDLFAVDSSDDLAPEPPADDFAFSPPPPPSVPAQPVQPLERGGPEFDDSSEDLGDLFQSDPEIGEPFADDDGPTAQDDSRAEQVNALIDEATTAWEDGDTERARDLVEGVLATEPGNIAALDLIAQIEAVAESVVADPIPIEAPAPEEPVPEETPETDSGSDLFAKEFDLPEDVPSSAHDARIPASEPTRGRGPLSGFPWRLVSLVGGGIAIVVVTMWLGSSFFSDNGDVEEERAQEVTRRLQEADALFEQGKAEEALHLLQTFPAEGIEKQRIDKRIARYQESMKPPPPTPIPQAFVDGRDLIDQGQWLEAYEAIESGLKDHPEDPGLRGLREEIAAIEPEVVPLFASLGNGDFATAVSIVSDLETNHTEQPGFAVIHERCLFNAALADLRTYNLTGARNYLEKLKVRRPQDTEVLRILEFVSSYSNRSVDMQLEIFVGSLEAR